jgi:hypothetical protein
MENENSFEKADDSSNEAQSGSSVSAEELIEDALSKGKMAEEKRRIIQRNEEPKARRFLPNWLTVVLAIVGALDISKALFKFSTLIAILLLLIFALSVVIHTLRRRIHVSNQSAYYYRNVLSSIGIFLGFLVLANHDQLTRRYSKIFMDNPQFYYSDDVDDYGRPSQELNVESESGWSAIPTIIQWCTVGVALGLPFLIWRTTNSSSEYWKETNRKNFLSIKSTNAHLPQ